MAFNLLPSKANNAQQDQGPNSASGMLATLIPSFLLACLFVWLFLALRVKAKRIYMPRTYLGSLLQHQKSPALSKSTFGWIRDFVNIPDEYALSHHSLDAYLFLRFWRLIILLCAIGWPITWIVLMPVYGTASAGQKQFDKISFSNISSIVDADRLYAVVVVSWLLFGAMMIIIGRETLFCLRLTQQYRSLPGVAGRMSARTVLFTNVPTSILDGKTTVERLFPATAHSWMLRDTKDLEETLKDRDTAATKLEAAIVKMSYNANQKRLKALEKNGGEEADEDPMRWVDEHKRPTHRLTPLIGEKVDTLDWCREELRKLVPKVESQQVIVLRDGTDALSAIFVEFSNVEAAEAAYHENIAEKPGRIRARSIGMRPEEVLWQNLSMGNGQRLARTSIAFAIIALMIVFWTPITAFIGAISNINSLTDKVPFLRFINNIPPAILGLVTGFLPTILLALAMVLVPIFMRLLFTLAGAATVAEVELKTQTWFFVFQVIQVFLVTTLSSGAAAVVTKISEDPSAAATLLASNLPKASNFYINYFVLNGVAASAQQLCNIAAVMLYVLLSKILDSTPRKMYNRYITLPGLQWGSVYPKFTNLAVIAITYSCIAPLILGFATIGLSLLYVAFRFSILYSVDTTPINTQGQAYQTALQQLTTGIYLAELCLIGLMGISSSSSTSAAGALVLEVILLVSTVVYHILLNQAIASLTKDLARRDGTTSTEPSDSTTEQLRIKTASLFERTLRVPAMPVFAEFLQTSPSSLEDNVRSKAYLHPAIKSPTPLIWIVQDTIGVSQREKEAVGDIVEVSDHGAWWADHNKGRLTTTWDANEEIDEDKTVKEAPLWSDKVMY